MAYSVIKKPAQSKVLVPTTSSDAESGESSQDDHDQRKQVQLKKKGLLLELFQGKREMNADCNTVPPSAVRQQALRSEASANIY